MNTNKINKIIAGLLSSGIIFVSLPSLAGSVESVDFTNPSVIDNKSTDVSDTTISTEVDDFGNEFSDALIKKKEESELVIQSANKKRDEAALTGINCKQIKDAAEEQAKSYVKAHEPPDPSKIIQNTTCFLNVATVKIPILSIGIGFIDAMIKKYIQQFLTNSCSKSTSFLGDLKADSLKAFDDATGGYGGMIESYANNDIPDLTTLQDNADEIADQLITDNGGTAAKSTKDVGTAVAEQQDKISRDFCAYGVPDVTYCPLCREDPYHKDCLGDKPYCGPSWPDEPSHVLPHLVKAQCAEHTFWGN